MKKIIAKTSLILFLIVLYSLLGYQIIYKPCVLYYSQYSYHGVILYLIVLAIIIFVVYILWRFVNWCIDNI